MKYRTEIDGLRALAVLPVILFHAGFEWFSGGFVGVDVFFVISGYLITTIIISEMAEAKYSIINFYERRARRILPALFFVMGVCLPIALLFLAPSDLKAFGHSLVAVSTFSSNILFWREAGYFDIASELKPFLHTWSLAIEEQFYILFPIFLIFIWKLGVKWVLALLLIVFFISLGIAHWGAYNSPYAAFYLLPTRGWELLIGVFAAFYLKYNAHLKSHITNQLLSSLGFGMIVFSIFIFNKDTPFPSLYTLIPTVGTGLLILCAVPKTFIYKFLSLKFFVGIGLISYSAYLWHQPILAFVRYRSLETTSDLVLLISCFASLILAWFSWRFIEAPFRSKEKFDRRSIFKLTMIFSLFFLSTGLWLNFNNGGLNYYSVEKQKVLKSFINGKDYVVEKHTEINLLEFNKTNNKLDIFIIGDSHSQDLVNAIFEIDFDTDKEFSSYLIELKCGSTSNCDYNDLLNSEIQNQISLADEIWIISSWKQSDVPYIAESLERIKNINHNIKLYGTKYFGSPSAKWYKFKNTEAWLSAIFNNNDTDRYIEVSKINEDLENIAQSLNIEFINTQYLICGIEIFCHNYVNGNIISYDGSHLTRHGAKILGTSLKVELNKRIQ